METVEEATAFIQESEAMISSLDQNPEELYAQLVGSFGECNDFESFKNFYQQFLDGCPNQNIVAGKNTPEAAENLWNTIDVNKSGTLDDSEKVVLVKAIIQTAIDLTKVYFNL